MPDTTLVAEKRTASGSAPSGRTRRAGRVPAVVYGLGEDTLSVTVDAREFDRILSSDQGANTLITLSLDGEDMLALARQVQIHPVRSEVLHVDFIRVRADEEVQAEIPVSLVGEATGVRNGGILDQSLFSLTVMARPGDLPPSIEVDVSALDIGDQLRVADVAAPPGVTFAVDADAMVAAVAAPSAVEEEEVEAEEGEEVEGAEPADEEAAGEDEADTADE